MKLTGKIMWISYRDENAVIVTDDGTEYYTDDSVFNDFMLANPKDKVTFILNEKITECKCARNVELV